MVWYGTFIFHRQYNVISKKYQVKCRHDTDNERQLIMIIPNNLICHKLRHSERRSAISDSFVLFRNANCVLCHLCKCLSVAATTRGRRPRFCRIPLRTSTTKATSYGRCQRSSKAHVVSSSTNTRSTCRSA